VILGTKAQLQRAVLSREGTIKPRVGDLPPGYSHTGVTPNLLPGLRCKSDNVSDAIWSEKAAGTATVQGDSNVKRHAARQPRSTMPCWAVCTNACSGPTSLANSNPVCHEAHQHLRTFVLLTLSIITAFNRHVQSSQVLWTPDISTGSLSAGWLQRGYLIIPF
jgi:hypothetical protein